MTSGTPSAPFGHVLTAMGRSDAEAGESPGAAYRRLRRSMIDAERAAFVGQRDAGEIDDEILRRVLRRMDFEEAMLDRDESD